MDGRRAAALLNAIADVLEAGELAAEALSAPLEPVRGLRRKI
jgi:hypothetical protein